MPRNTYVHMLWNSTTALFFFWWKENNSGTQSSQPLSAFQTAVKRSFDHGLFGYFCWRETNLTCRLWKMNYGWLCCCYYVVGQYPCCIHLTNTCVLTSDCLLIYWTLLRNWLFILKNQIKWILEWHVLNRDIYGNESYTNLQVSAGSVGLITR